MSLRPRKTIAALAAVGACAALGVSASSAGAAAFTPPGHCKSPEGTVGQGSSLQSNAHGIWHNAFYDNSNTTTPTPPTGVERGLGCGDGTALVTHTDGSTSGDPYCTSGTACNADHDIVYRKSSSGQGLEAWCAQGPNYNDPNFSGPNTSSTFCPSGASSADRWVGTDVPPTPTEVNNIIAATGGAGNQQVHTVPVAQTSVAVMVHLPANCTVSGNHVTLNNADLETLFEGNGTWGMFGAVGTGCTGTPLREVRSDVSGTTWVFSLYMQQIWNAEHPSGGTNPWDALVASRGGTTAWPNQSTVSTGPTAQQNNSGGNLSKNTATIAGTVGYATVADAQGKGFGRQPANPPNQTTQIFWADLQNNGVGTTGGNYTDPLNPDLSGKANCNLAHYNNVPTTPTTDPTLGDWSSVYGSDPNVGSYGYPLCALTYDELLDKYSINTSWGDTQSSANQFQDVQDYFRYVTDPNHSTGGDTVIGQGGYYHVPGSMLSVANHATYAITY